MSDTDDTDDLLLIPPDLFVIDSDSEDSLKPYGPYYSVVDTLITQVHSLEDRVNHIETFSDTGLMNSSSNLMTEAKRFSSLNELSNSVDVYPGSSQSTPQKPKVRDKRSSLPSTPNVDTVKKGSRLQYDSSSTHAHATLDIEEINSFISHVKNIQKHDAARNLNPVFESLGPSRKTDAAREHSKIQTSNVDRTVWDRPSAARTSTSSTISEPIMRTEKLWKMGDTKDSVPDRGMGMRDFLYNKDVNNATLKELSLSSLGSELPLSSDNLQSAHNSESVYSDPESVSSSDSTQLTTVHQSANGQYDKIHSDALDVLDKHKKILLRSNNDVTSLVHKESKQKKSRSASTRKKLVLMSLSELWNQNFDVVGDCNANDHLKSYNKLQEEKLRRQHCENLILHLQGRMLELQEQVSVAIQVDEAKDDAIVQIHKLWEDSSIKINNLNGDKTQLESQIAEMNRKMSTELAEAVKKVSHYESEASKALNLAHMNQEKVVALEKQNVLLQAGNQSYEDRLGKLESDLEREHSNNQQLSRILSQKEIELSENKNVQTQATKEVAQSKRAVEMCQAELTSIKAKQVQFETKYSETLTQIKELEGAKKKLLAEVENYKKIEKNLKDELFKIKETNEQGKADLRTFYQNQVEILVREKLKEFQQQLEKAENSLQEQMRSRELSIAKNAAIHIQQINEKNVLEIRLLEEKHREEMKLQKLQLFQSQQEISNLQTKFQQQQAYRTNIVQQLQRVMETQWFEALKIIDNGKSPIIAQDKSTNTIDQLNLLKSRSYNNLEEILFRDEGYVGRNVPMQQGGNAASMKLFDNSASTLDDSYNKIVETPVSSRGEKNRQQGENDFQKYIQMLLNKQPGNPTEEQLLKRHEICENQAQDGTKLNRGGSKERFGKRPWK